jgi:Flp pilus assembly protein TadG
LSRSSNMASRSRRESGATTVMVAVALTALLAFASLALDVGMVWSARNQLQNGADSAALAGARNLIDSGGAVDVVATQTGAQALAAENSALGVASISIDTSDIQLGQWNAISRTFNSSVDLSDPSVVNAVEVRARMDATSNGPVSAILSQFVGIDSYSLQATATAELGYAGSSLPGEVELPITIDCCQIAGASCSDDYCSTISSSPPNPCSLDAPQAGDTGPVSCLEFHSTNDQNACWTSFDGSSPSVNTADLRDLVETGAPSAISTNDSFYVDNGDKTPVIGTIDDRFQGNGAFVGEGEGVDRYSPFDGSRDSWVVKLPVIECQGGTHCSSGGTADIVGFVCFELREIVVTPDKVIRGRFLCPSDPLYNECDSGNATSGGLNFGVRAEIPVLVR